MDDNRLWLTLYDFVDDYVPETLDSLHFCEDKILSILADVLETYAREELGDEDYEYSVNF